MSDDNAAIEAIEQIVTELDSLLREKLRAANLAADHVILAITSEGDGVVRSNVEAEDLTELSEMLGDIAHGAVRREAQKPN
jgi:hypothetical protein